MQIFLILALLIAAVAVVFALQNAATATIAFLFWQFEGSLALVLLIALGTGVLIGFLASLPTLVRGGWTTSSQKRQLKKLEGQVADYRRQLDVTQAQLADLKAQPAAQPEPPEVDSE